MMVVVTVMVFFASMMVIKDILSNKIELVMVVVLMRV